VLPVAHRTLLLTRAEVAGLLSWENVLPVVEETFVALATGAGQLFPTVREGIPRGTLGLRSGIWPERGLFGVKVSGFFLANRELGLDSHQALVVLLDPKTGRPTAVVDGNHVTWIRTAAAGLAGTLALARPDAHRVLVIGNGLQAEAQIRSHAWGLAEREPQFAVHAPRDGRDGEKARHFVDRLSEHGIDISPAPDLGSALADADIVLTATPAAAPLFGADAVRPGTHITAMGADAPGKRELDDELVRRAHLVVDDPAQSVYYGEAQALGEVQGELPALGGILDRTVEGRRDASEITIFDSTGLGLHDVATADLARSLAVQKGVGAYISF
jgi:alanine dehydrogenase